MRMKVGDQVFFLVSRREIRPATVKQVFGKMCILEFKTGGICLPLSRVYTTREEAAEHVAVHTEPQPSGRNMMRESNQMELREMYDFSGKPLG